MSKQYPIYILLIIFTFVMKSLVAETHPAHPAMDSTAVHTETAHENHEGHNHEAHTPHAPAEHGHTEHHECGAHHGPFNAGENAVHHISDANIYSIGPLNIPLPCIVYVKGEGIKVFSSSKFKPGSHGNGQLVYDNFVLNGGSLNRIVIDTIPLESSEVCSFGHKTISIEKTDKEGLVVATPKEVNTVILKNGQEYLLESKTTLDGGLFGGGITSFYDFSITKNVASMLVVVLLLMLMFYFITQAYKKREGNAPKGIQSVVEPIFTFIQDEVSKPILGHSWEKYQPFLMSLFFFILGLNLFGLVPFFGGSNVTGNISVTIALAIFTALVVNLSGNKHYWGHILWMPGVPGPLKVLILTPVEILGVFLKPMTLFIRLFGNISAGHMVILIFTSLIFIFGNDAEGNIIQAGSAVGVVMATLLGMFMMALELLVAFLQAFVFTILTAVYIGSAIEEHH